MFEWIFVRRLFCFPFICDLSPPISAYKYWFFELPPQKPNINSDSEFFTHQKYISMTKWISPPLSFKWHVYMCIIELNIATWSVTVFTNRYMQWIWQTWNPYYGKYSLLSIYVRNHEIALVNGLKTHDHIINSNVLCTRE